ncbi:MAG: class I SAM-dependent methyltransferase [Gracilimonas sp.]|uniref:class I SAM-dependent methyltransferase n=1 Tax=Gracilimonas TaxID=649462 RepID=UPI001B03995D|nr:class I SAM-dependent methyltransferase [Gracilimonas sp.]MBO6586803.1 class I SAM-dependent methyltransferase [Gracilimonas sp.]MBO6614709.1 class I SAM-dependent methyltransferase [Gracilimonas sp.]
MEKSKNFKQQEIQLIIKRVSQFLQNNRAEREAQIPKVALKNENVANCTLLLNREMLLEKMKKNSVVAEIGVDEGHFSRLIRNVVQPKKFHLVDIWGTDRFHEGKYQDVKACFQDEIDEGKVQIHRKLSTEAAVDFEDGYFDWIYIDTDHSYETTRDELNKYAPKVKKGGIIAGHDYVTGNWITTYRYGVIEAVHEFCVKNHWELLYITVEPTENQSFAIRKIQDS